MSVDIKKQLKKYASLERKKSNEWFFKTGEGEYGEGDVFLGVRVPDVRKVAKNNLDITFVQLQENFRSKFHEVRLCVILILVEKNKQALKLKNQKIQKQILNFYKKNLKYVNNWDLVDLSAHYILGQAILNDLERENLLDELAQSKKLWQRRVSIISTWIFIKEGKINTTLRLAKKLLDDQEDLMHKAVGWMLREVWKLGEKNNISKNRKGKLAQEKVEKFLIKNYSRISRTTLRYTIERMSEKKRKIFLQGKF